MPIDSMPPQGTPGAAGVPDGADGESWADGLSREERHAAAIYALSNRDMDLPDAPGLDKVLGWIKNDISGSADMLRNREAHAFANLLGAIGGGAGALAGYGIGNALGSERATWVSTMLGAAAGMYPAAIAGAVVDRVID